MRPSACGGPRLPVFQDTRGAFVSAALTETCTVMGGLVVKDPSITWNSTFHPTGYKPRPVSQPLAANLLTVQ